MSKYIISYAQNREDVIIEGFFPDIKNGFYVDVGANHPIFHSVTKRFYDKGWRGINLEPNPMLIAKLKKERPKDTNLDIGIADKAGELEIRIYHSRDGLEGISTFSKEMQNQYLEKTDDDSKNYTDVKVKVRTLATVFNEQKVQHIHFMKIDVEGFEAEVINGNNWTKYRPELICIEANHIINDWTKTLADADYILAFNDGLNNYYLAKESIHRKQNFDYAKTFLSDKPVITQELNTELKVLEDRADNWYKGILERDQMILDLQHHTAQQQEILDQITPLKKHIKRQVKARLNKKKKA